MADLTTKYAGMELKSPLFGGSGPNYDSVEGCRAAADAGFSGFVLKSFASQSLGKVAYQHAVPRYKMVYRLQHSRHWKPDSGEENMDVVFAGEVGSAWGEAGYADFANKDEIMTGEGRAGFYTSFPSIPLRFIAWARSISVQIVYFPKRLRLKAHTSLPCL